LKDDLTNMIIHDMRTPLSSIQLGLQFVLYNSPDLPEMQRKTLGIAHTSMSQLTKMVNDLLDINRMEQGNVILNKQAFSLYPVVLQRFEELDTLAALDEKKFVADIPEDLPALKADRDLVARVLGNLLSNALRYAPAQSLITVSARATTTDGKGVQISVHNDGRPIPVEYQRTVFEKFHQLDIKRASGQGVGLGLAFCKMAVEAHRGTIWVESEEGRGTTFHFILPLSD
jgi:NtrC-family two-component system sensor histidine kinase KinB